jgi:hypothetical protein
VTTRLPDAYFDELYATSDDPWQLSSRWYEERKYSITLSLLPRPRYRHAFEPAARSEPSPHDLPSDVTQSLLRMWPQPRLTTPIGGFAPRAAGSKST